MTIGVPHFPAMIHQTDPSACPAAEERSAVTWGAECVGRARPSVPSTWNGRDE